MQMRSISRGGPSPLTPIFVLPLFNQTQTLIHTIHHRTSSSLSANAQPTSTHSTNTYSTNTQATIRHHVQPPSHRVDAVPLLSPRLAAGPGQGNARRDCQAAQPVQPRARPRLRPVLQDHATARVTSPRVAAPDAHRDTPRP